MDATLTLAPQRIDEHIALCRQKNMATGQRKYWTMVVVAPGARPIVLDMEYGLPRAQNAVDSARWQLPLLMLQYRADTILAQLRHDATLAQIKRETGDVGPQPDKVPA